MLISPTGISRYFRGRGYIPVKGLLNDTPNKGTLVPVAGGKHRLYINTEMRRKPGTKVGDDINLQLEIDTEPGEMTIPEHLRQALESNKEAKIAFEKLPPSYQREILAYLDYLKTPAALERNVRKVIDTLMR